MPKVLLKAKGDGMQQPKEFEVYKNSKGSVKARFITPGFRWGFIAVTSLFFLWAIANNFNDILIRQFQKALDLNRAQAGLIQFVFYIGYFIVALPAGLVLRRFGYRAGILTGLALYAIGALLFWPAAEVREYYAFLAALFILAAGAAFLETSANPYIVAFGDPERAPQRLNLAQAFNGIGGMLAPALGGLFIFSGVEHDANSLATMSAVQLDAYRASEARMVQLPYLTLAVVVLLLAVVIAKVRLPNVDEQADYREQSLAAIAKSAGLGAAVAAQFCYVGAQVGIWSFFVDFVKDSVPSTPEKTAAYLLALSLALFTAGRFMGAALMQRVTAGRLLYICALINIFLCAAAAATNGWMAICALGLTSLFMSIMFPTIFALGVRNLGPQVALGSSLLVMAVIGGALLPPLMGLVAEASGGLHAAMLLPLLCFGVVAIFARSVKPDDQHVEVDQ
jgi:MFS transporter, FHS family, L-fucose permease